MLHVRAATLTMREQWRVVPSIDLTHRQQGGRTGAVSIIVPMAVVYPIELAELCAIVK